MSNTLKFKGHYFILALIIFFIEILIALFVHDRIIRPYAGDFLVVILIYCFVRSFIDTSVIRLAISVLIFSYVVETLQYFNILSRLGLQDSKLAKTIMGSSFEWADLVAYTVGIVLVLYVEKVIAGKIYKSFR
jgi:hypothetical protein